MKEVIQRSLKWHVDKIEHYEPFSLARYGDGELYCIWDRGTQNSHGCQYTPELKQSLFKGLHDHVYDPRFVYGLQKVLYVDRVQILRETLCTWYDSEIFGDELVAGNLYPLFEVLRRRRVVVIANVQCIAAAHAILPDAGLVTIPRNDSYKYREAIYSAFDHYMKENKPTIFLFSAGIGATAIVHELHGRSIHATLIDFGHIWDAFAGEQSRCNTVGITQEILVKNLQPVQ